jgi:hypothetical protein
MIVFDLECRTGGHRFEGWFGSSEDFDQQRERGFLSCPECGSADVAKALSPPKLGRKGNQLPATRASRPQPMASAMPPEAAMMMRALHAMQTEALKNSRWVGDRFAEETRAMYYGERDAETIHGHATLEEAKALYEEGIEATPLPFPVAPPGEAN